MDDDLGTVEDDRETTVELRVGLIIGMAIGSLILSPILVFYEALLGLIALVSGGAIGAGPSLTAGRRRAGGTIISIGLGLLAGPIFYLVAWAVSGVIGSVTISPLLG